MSIINWLKNNMLRRDANWASKGDIEMEIINCIVVRVCGGARTDRLEGASANSFRKAMFQNVARTVQPGCSVILDLHGVNHIDDNGLGAILSVMQAMQEKTEFLICGVGENLKKIFQLTRVDGVLQSYENVAEAEHEAWRRIQKKRAGVQNKSSIQKIIEYLTPSSHRVPSTVH
jgi:anti-anti-sigma factor